MKRYANDVEAAEAIVAVLPDSRWIGTGLAQAYLWALNGDKTEEDIVRHLYEKNFYTLSMAREIVPTLAERGFLGQIKARTKTGSAENPITKLFPAAITEQRFLEQIDALRAVRRTVNYEDDRESGHTLVDFTLTEGDVRLPINVKNAGTRFENAKPLVGLEPDDCIPIPVYKAYDAMEKEQDLLYAVAVDYDLVNSINARLIPLFDRNEAVVWRILNDYSGTRIRHAEDTFIYGITARHWDSIRDGFADPEFRLISARKSVRILQKQPKRTPGIGPRAWGTGANAEVNVHISIAKETTPWRDVFERIVNNGPGDIVAAINRKKTEVVDDPEI